MNQTPAHSTRVSRSTIESLESRTLLHGAATSEDLSNQGPDITPDQVTATGWSSAANTDQSLFEAQSVVASGKLFLFGGFYNTQIQVTNEVHAYDLASNTWADAGTSPAPETHPGVATDGRMIYFAGGYRGDWADVRSAATHDFWMFDSQTGVWQRGPNLPGFYGAGGLALVGRTLHFVGGLEMGGAKDSADHWVLDLDHQSAGWTRKADLPDPRNHIGVTQVDGKIYVIGGQHALDEANGIDDEVDVYDPATDLWSQAASLPSPRSHLHNSTFTYGGKIYCVGGTDLGNISSSDVIAYDPTTNAWSMVGQLPAPRSATAATAFGDTLIVATGTPTGVRPQSTTWTRSLASSWLPTSDLGGAVPPAVGSTDTTSLNPGSGIADVNGLLAGFTSVPPDQAVGGTKGKATVRLTNTGTEKLTGKRSIELFLSADSTLDASDMSVIATTKSISLKPSKGKSFSLKFKYPEQLAGSYFLLTSVQSVASVTRTMPDQTIAASAEQVVVTPPFVDLTGQLEVGTKSVSVGKTSTVVLNLQNLGNTTMKGKVSSVVVASLVGDSSGTQTTLQTSLKSVSIAAGKSKRLRLRIKLPDLLVARSYALTANLGFDGSPVESDLSNNAAVASSALSVA